MKQRSYSVEKNKISDKSTLLPSKIPEERYPVLPAAGYGLDDPGYMKHAAFFDYDGDGSLDCYILNNSFILVNTLNYSNKRELNAKGWPVKEFLQGGNDKLMRNTKEGLKM